MSRLRTGTFCKCERCGAEEFFEDKERLGDSQSNFAHSYWRIINGKLACPICADVYEVRMVAFWNNDGK